MYLTPEQISRLTFFLKAPANSLASQELDEKQRLIEMLESPEQEKADPLSICNPEGVKHLIAPIALNAHQLKNALDFVNPGGANDPDELESIICIQRRKEAVFDGENYPAGYYAWFEDYPEEGSIYLDDDKSTLTHPAHPSQTDIRGFLAAKLKCWHRLKGEDADEITALLITHLTPAQPAPAQADWTDEQLQMLNFLYGAGEWDGLWFEEKHPTKKGAFWWRTDLRRLFTCPPAQPEQMPTGQQIDAMVDRFLGWGLPFDFNPDAGISFQPSPNINDWPIGTNLLTAEQAKDMLVYVTTGKAIPTNEIRLHRD